MAMHYDSRPSSALNWGCRVALLESRELRSVESARYLSNREIAKYIVLPSQSRRSAWLAGRLAAKYLFLNRLEMSAETNRQWVPTLVKLSSQALGAYSPWMYQQVEVLPSESTSSHPKIVWCGKDRRESVSLSHAGGASCACIGIGSPTAVDIETAVPRIDAFYRN